MAGVQSQKPSNLSSKKRWVQSHCLESIAGQRITERGRSKTRRGWNRSDYSKSNPGSTKSTSRRIVLDTANSITKDPAAKRTVPEKIISLRSAVGRDQRTDFDEDKDDVRVIEWIKDCQDPTIVNLIDDNGTKLTGINTHQRTSG